MFPYTFADSPSLNVVNSEGLKDLMEFNNRSKIPVIIKAIVLEVWHEPLNTVKCSYREF
jgi:hypothetical protein